jgi:hypothetical protein
VQVPARIGGGTREANRDEALAMTIAALANVSQWTDVTWTTTTDAQGRPCTLLTLAGVQGEERSGKTILIPKETVKNRT